MGRHFKHPATVIAAIALFVALGGGAVAYASGLIPGSKIKNHSISSKKLTKAAVTEFTAQKPDGKIVTYNATATSATPTPTPVGTFLGDSLSASCAISSGTVTMTVYIQTSDGSWAADISNLTLGTSSSVFVNSFSVPPGTITAASPIAAVSAGSGATDDSRIEFTQVLPLPGAMTWNEAVGGTAQTCHLSVEYSPETVTAVAGASHPAHPAPARLSHLLGSR